MPNVNAEEEIDKIISSQAYRLPQIEQLRSNLAKLRISVHSKDEDIGVTAFFTATGLLSLVNNLKKQPVQKIGLYVSSAWTIAFGGWSAKNYVDRQKLVASVEEIEKEIDSIDEEVRANIKTDLPQLLNQ